MPGYFEAMRAVCDKHGALLILDEIMSGVGRTGSLHAWQSPLIGVEPDLQTLGKGLGGGYAPVAALLVNNRVVDALQKGSGAFSHGQTYQGHPISCRVALEVQREIKEKRLVENVAELGVYMKDLLEEKIAPLPFVGNVRGRGFFWGVRVSTTVRRLQSDLPLRRLNSSRTRIPRYLLRQVEASQWVFTRKV